MLLVDNLNVVSLVLKDTDGAGFESGFLINIHPIKSPTTSVVRDWDETVA